MPTYLGRNVVTMPSSPPAPSAIEASVNQIVADTVGTFSGNQQVYDYGAGPMELSIAMPPMTPSQAPAWIVFFKAIKGVSGVFQFPSGVAAAFPDTFTTDGTTQRYWCLKGNQVKWSIQLGPIYSVTFEVREVT